MSDYSGIASRLPRLDIDGCEADIKAPCGPTRTAIDMARGRGVQVWALTFEGRAAGSIVWTAGARITCTIHVYTGAGPLGVFPISTGNAGGSGYCRQSASFADALHRWGLPEVEYRHLNGVGLSACRRWLVANGYLVVEAL